MAVLWSESWAYANGTAPATITPGYSSAGSSMVVQSSKLVATTGTSTGGAGKTSRHAVITAVTNYELLATNITLVSTTGDYTGDLVLRAEDAVDGQNGYSLGFRMDLNTPTFTWYVVKAVNYTYTMMLNPVTVAGITAGSTINFRFRAVGSVIQARMWKTGDPEPATWALNVTDPSPYNVAGAVGWDLAATDGANRQVSFGPMTITDGASTNVAPTANAGPDQSNIAPFTTVYLSGAGSDTDGTIASYTWTQTAGPTVQLSGTGANRSFVAPAVLGGTTLTFALTTTDNQGATSTPDTVNTGITRATLLRNDGAGWVGVRLIKNHGGQGANASGASLALSASGTARGRAAAGTASLALTASGSATLPGGTLTRFPAQPGGIYYGNLTGPTTTAYRKPGALVVTSRGNFGNANMVAAARAGAHVIGYFDALVWAVFGSDDVSGRLFNSSVYGAAVPKWPGPVNANSTGDLADFRPGSVMHSPSATNSSWTKLEAVLESIVAENPHLSGFFADDVGSRSWYPNFSWDTFGSQNQSDYRAGAILVVQAFRRVCNRHNMFLLVNGTWSAGTLASNGGGYPTLTSHGCSLADGGVWEHHDPTETYGDDYMSGSQWGSGSPITGAGKAFNLAIIGTTESVTPWTNKNIYSWIVQSTDYTVDPPAPWGSFHVTGLPTYAPLVQTATASLSLTATGTAVGSSGMAPPAGAVLNDNLTTLSAWNSEDPAMVGFSTQSGTGPGGDPILRNTLIDGQRPSWDPPANERNDMSGPDVPQGGVRWMIWYERIISIPTNLGVGGWMLLGPNEIHGQTLTQATFMPQIGTSWNSTPSGTALQGRKILNANGGRDTGLFYDVGTVDLGNWHQYKFGVFYTTGSNGWFELWRDGVRVIRFDGITTTETPSGYWKFANYRNTELNGTSTYDISGCRVYRVGSL